MTAGDIMNYIVLDLEWNQSPNGKIKEEPLLPFEIIEIGAVKMNSEHMILDRFHEIIRPQVYTTLHHMTREIITLTEKDLADKRLFPEVAADFIDWCGENPAFCTWGPGDLLELQRNFAWHSMENPFRFPLFYYDIQKIFSIVYEDRKTRRSLEHAVDFLQLSKEIPFHDAYDDALYTARVMKHLSDEDILNNSSVDYYRTPANRRQEIHINYKTYYKYVSKPFASKADAMKDRMVASTRCYLCHQSARKKIRWFSSGSRNYFCLAWCQEHGWLKGKARMRQHENGSYYVVKTLKLVDDEEAYSIREKQEVLRVKRRLKKAYTTHTRNTSIQEQEGSARNGRHKKSGTRKYNSSSGNKYGSTRYHR